MSEIAILGRGFESLLSALSVVVILMLDGWVSANHGDEGDADEQCHNNESR